MYNIPLFGQGITMFKQIFNSASLGFKQTCMTNSKKIIPKRIIVCKLWKNSNFFTGFSFIS